MNATDIRRQESESDVFDVEKGYGKKYKMKRRNFCIYSIVIQTVVTVIMVGLVLIIDRKLILHRLPPVNDSSATETTSYQMLKTELMALEDTKRGTRGAAHLFCNQSKTLSDEFNRLMWIDPPTSNSFVSEGINFHSNNGSLQVKESGIYQIYSKLTLEHTGANSTQNQSYSAIQRNGKLLSREQFNFPLPGLLIPGAKSIYHVLHFGIYHLDAGDTVCITLDKDSIKYISKWVRDSFFGLNLIGPR